MINVLTLFYSVLSASTGSFLAAFPDGIRLAINVNIILNPTNTTALHMGRWALISVVLAAIWIIELIGISSSNAIPTPIIPANKPTINVSALNTWEIFLLDAPIARRIPISLRSF